MNNSKKIICQINNLINVDMELPENIFREKDNFYIYFEEPEAITIDSEIFFAMVKKIAEITNDKEVYVISKFVQKHMFKKKKHFYIEATINVCDSLDTMIQQSKIEDFDIDFPFLYKFFYFPSQKALFFMDDSCDIAILAISKEIKITIPWYPIEEFFEVENLGMKERINLKYEKKFKKNYG